MAESVETKYIISGEASSAIKALKDTDKAATDLDKDLQKTQKSAANFSSSLTGYLEKNRAGFVALGAASTGVFLGIAGFVAKGVQLASQLEKSRVALDTLTGSAKEGGRIFKELRLLGAQTPFETKDLIDSAQVLLAYNVNAKTLTDTIRRLGDIASGDAVKLKTLSLAFGQVQAKGKLAGQEVLQFANAGVGLVDQLAKNMGKTTAQIQEMISDGKIGFPEVERALHSLTDEGGRFYQMSIKQSKTLGGLMSTLNDYFGMTLASMVGLSAGGEIIQGSLIDKFKQLVIYLIPIIDKMANWVEANQKLVGVVIVFTLAISGLVAVLSAIALVLPTVIAGMSLLMGPVGIAIAGVVALSAAWATNFGHIREITESVVKAIIDIGEGDWRNAWENMKDGFAIFSDDMDKLTIPFGQKMSKGFGDIMDNLSNIFLQGFTDAMDGGSNALLSGFETMMDSASNAVIDGFGSIMDYMSNIVITGFADIMDWAYDFGVNLISTIAAGIDSKINTMINSVSGVATIISDYLGFHSPTKKGPGSDADKWMPSMVRMMIDGINQNKSPFEKTVNDLAAVLGKGFSKKKMDEIKGNIREFVTDANKAFNDMNSQLQKSFDKVQDLGKEWIDLRKKMTDILSDISDAQKDKTSSLAGRAVEIQKELADLAKERQDKMNSGTYTGQEDTDYQAKIEALNKELAFIREKGVSETDIIAARAEADKTEAQHIIDRADANLKDLEQKRAAIAEEIKLKEDQIKKEWQQYQDLKEAKKKFAKEYFDITNTYLDLEISKTEQLIQKMEDLAAAKRKAGEGATGTPGRAIGGPVIAGRTYTVGENGPEQFVAPLGGGRIIPTGGATGGGMNQTINITIDRPVVRDEMDIRKIANTVKEVLKKEAINYRLNVA